MTEGIYWDLIEPWDGDEDEGCFDTGQIIEGVAHRVEIGWEPVGWLEGWLLGLWLWARAFIIKIKCKKTTSPYKGIFDEYDAS